MRLRREARWIWPIAVIMVIALACAAYILNKQRLDNPFAERYSVEMEFDAIHAVIPGLGSPLTVAGVTVGQIDQARLENGRGILRASIDPEELPRIYADAAAALIPNTPLKDMQIRLNPGTRASGALPDDGRIEIAATTTPVDADELLRALDGDTRDWMRTLIAELGRGTEGRGRDLRSTLRALGPTAAQARRITGLLASRREEIARLVSNLRVISEAADDERDLRRVVDAGQATLEAVATNAEPLRRSLELLPGTLRSTRTTLDRVQPLARSLSATLEDLDPSLQALPSTLSQTPGALRGLVPLPVKQLNEFIDGVGPLARDVAPAAADLKAGGPLLERSFKVLGRAVNALAFQDGPDSESYLFYLAWFAHNANSVLSTQDAHGGLFRGYALFSCASQEASPDITELIEGVFGVGGTCPEGQP